MRLHNLHWVFLFTALVSDLFYVAYAADIEWRGFLSTGTSFSDSSTPYVNGTNKKAQFTNETFLGLNLSKELDNDWRLAAQFVARAGQADTATKADWVFVSYDPPNPFDITIGKQKIPMWMMSAYLDVGRAYPWTIPPEEVYMLFNIRSFTGISIGYTLTFGDSALTFKPYGGDTSVESSPNAPTATSKLSATNLGGASLEWTWNKLLLRSAYNQAIWDLNLGPDLQFGERRYQILTHGLRYEKDGLLILAEFASTKDLDEKKHRQRADEFAIEAQAAAAAGDNERAESLFNQALLNRVRLGGAQGYYATIGRQFQNIFPHATYANLKRRILETVTSDQEAYALGVNYDLNVDSVIKAEARRIKLSSDSQGLFSAKPSDSRIMVYRLSYSLIF